MTRWGSLLFGARQPGEWRPLVRQFRAAQRVRYSTKSGPPYSILFFGTDHISVPTLSALKADWQTSQRLVRNLEVVEPVPPRPRSHVALYNALEGIPVHSANDAKTLKRWEVPCACDGAPFDIGVVVSCKYFLPGRVIRAFRLGVINMHPSLLPRHRGAAPIQWTLASGDAQTGVSIMKIEPKQPMDSGDILLQRPVAVPPDAMHSELQDTLGQVGAGAVMDALADFPELWRTAPRQPEHGVTFAPKITAQGLVCFADRTAAQVYDLWRGLFDNGGVYGYFLRDGEEEVRRIRFKRLHRLDTLGAELLAEVDALPEATPGSLYFPQAATPQPVFCVACAVDSPGTQWVACSQISLEGLKAKSAPDFLRICGRDAVGTVVPFGGDAGCLVEVEEDEEDP